MASETDNYTQVRVCHADGSFDTVWIPTKFAKVGKVLRIGDEDGWVVREVYATATREYVDAQRAFRLAMAECVH